MMLRCKSWLLLLLFVFVLGGISSCSSIPKHPVKDSELSFRTASFYKLGNKSYTAGQYEKAALYFEEALALHAAIDDRAGVSKSLSALGRVQMAQGEFSSAAIYFQRALSSTTDLQRPDLAAQALGGLSAVALQQNDPEEAMVWLDKALALPLDDTCIVRAVLLHDKGVAHKMQGNFEQAGTNFQQSLAMHESLQNTLGIAAGCYSLALLNETTGNLDQAISFAHRALENDKKGENPPGVAQDLTLLGSLATKNELPEDAVDYYQRALLAWQAMGHSEKCSEVSSQLKSLVPVD